MFEIALRQGGPRRFAISVSNLSKGYLEKIGRATPSSPKQFSDPFRYDEEIRAMSLEEAILDSVRRLPPVKQEEVLRFAASLRQPSARRAPVRDRAVEMNWIAENRSAFADPWVAVEGGCLIAADSDPLKVYSAAKAAGIASPFAVHILPEDETPFVPGW